MSHLNSLKKQFKYLVSYLFPFRYFNRIRIFGFDQEREIKRSVVEKLGIVFSNSEIVIPFMDLDITTFCNLKCKRCAKLTPYFNIHHHFSSDEIAKSLELMTRFVDKIYVVNIIGGEPLLNPELCTIIKICSENKAIQHLELTTNASLEPSDELLEIIKNCDVDVHISDYRYLSSAQQRAKEAFIQKLIDYGIRYEYQFHDIWLDFGEVELHDYSDIELHSMYVHCPMNSCAVYNNSVLYKCGRRSYLSQHRLVADGNDCIDFSKIETREELRERIKLFYSAKYSEACRYCLSHPTAIPAGEQMEN